MNVLAAQDWHWWISVVLVFVAVLMVIGVIFGYVVKVVAPRYPARDERRQ